MTGNENPFSGFFQLGGWKGAEGVLPVFLSDGF